ncbi:hypothetical protein [Burkholderia stabilis]|uniref:hypothetical protein n=1 Tax=Burkholderia stabilis TaxID=95485 RepID=UPI00158CF4F9|nr:hypothetical protein [Burkholderia stabilis]
MLSAGNECVPGKASSAAKSWPGFAPGRIPVDRDRAIVRVMRYSVHDPANGLRNQRVQHLQKVASLSLLLTVRLKIAERLARTRCLKARKVQNTQRPVCAQFNQRNVIPDRGPHR